MKPAITIAVAIMAAVSMATAEAKGSGKGGGGKSYSSSSQTRSYLSPRSGSKGAGPGAGSKSSSAPVRGYMKKDGTYVAPSRRTTPDGNYRNNYSAKGNLNPTTGKVGTRVEPSKKR